MLASAQNCVIALALPQVVEVRLRANAMNRVANYLSASVSTPSLTQAPHFWNYLP
jgi:hypothetical protein